MLGRISIDKIVGLGRRPATPEPVFRHLVRAVHHIVPVLFGPGGIIGGAERYAFELARFMADQVPTTLVTFGDEDSDRRVGPLRVRVIGQPWYVRGQRSNPFAVALLRELRYSNVVHCHQPHVIASSFAAAICRLRHRRVFTTEHGGGSWDISAYISTDRWYHGHLHVSEYSRRIHGHTGRPWAHVISGGVDSAKFCPDSQATRDGPVLFVGRLLPHKGVDDLIRAVGPDIPLELIGPAPDRVFLRELHGLAASKRVIFQHDVSDAELVSAYRRALCIVLPSVYRTAYGQETQVPELLGQTLLEGMACGIPAVCTNVASLPEIVEHGVTGLVVLPNDVLGLRRALQRLQDHPEAARAMGTAGRRRILAHFTWPHVTQRCLDIYSGSAH